MPSANSTHDARSREEVVEDDSMTFRELQTTIDAWISQYEAGYWPPLANLARLTEEVGELAREINHAFGPKTKKSTEQEGSIAEELGDILFTVAAIANSLDIDLDTVMRANLEKVTQRDDQRWERRR
jgi:NTP pyrophosphatase (non-canonical NTP hydrolase)